MPEPKSPTATSLRKFADARRALNRAATSGFPLNGFSAKKSALQIANQRSLNLAEKRRLSRVGRTFDERRVSLGKFYNQVYSEYRTEKNPDPEKRSDQYAYYVLFGRLPEGRARAHYFPNSIYFEIEQKEIDKHPHAWFGIGGQAYTGDYNFNGHKIAVGIGKYGSGRTKAHEKAHLETHDSRMERSLSLMPTLVKHLLTIPKIRSTAEKKWAKPIKEELYAKVREAYYRQRSGKRAISWSLKNKKEAEEFVEENFETIINYKNRGDSVFFHVLYDK